jgi:hypothetical protein
VAFGFVCEGIYESQPIVAQPGDWVELSVPISGKAFKCEKTQWVNFDSELPSMIATNLLIYVYTREPFELDIAGITLK